MKRCCKCGLPKNVKEFSIDRSRKDGRQPKCKSCAASYYDANREKQKEQMRKYREANREKLADRQRKYHAANREECNERSRKYGAVNSEQRKECNREYYAANRERIAERVRKYRAYNREKVAEQRRGYYSIQPGGVYRLTCVPTGDVYFGSTGNLQSRRNHHIHRLRKGDHENPTIRELSKTHSPDDFEFQTLLYCSEDERLYFEQRMMETRPCCNKRAAIR